MRKEPEKLRVGRGRDWLSREFRGQSQNILIFNPDGREDLGSPIHPAHGWNTQYRNLPKPLRKKLDKRPQAKQQLSNLGIHLTKASEEILTKVTCTLVKVAVAFKVL